MRKNHKPMERQMLAGIGREGFLGQMEPLDRFWRTGKIWKGKSILYIQIL